LSELIGAGLSGHLHLVCATNSERGTFLARQAFSAPMHLSKTYWNGDTLLINVVNQTAGFFGGDSITTNVVIESGARVLLSSPSAARFHPSHGRESRLEQTFTICSGGSLDIFPEISIPQRDSQTIQKTRIQLERGAELIYVEMLAPGRVASGEIFAFKSYAWSTEIRMADQWIHRERATIISEGASSAGLRALFPASYYASIILVSSISEDWQTDFPRAIAEGSDPSRVQIAVSKLSTGGWSIRLLAANSIALRESIQRVRRIIYERLGRKRPDPRKNELAR
jgi:urease accessory protein